MLAYLIAEWAVMANCDYSEAEILEFTSYDVIATRSPRGIVVRPIDENANPWHTVAFVEEIRLGWDIRRLPLQ